MSLCVDMHTTPAGASGGQRHGIPPSVGAGNPSRSFYAQPIVGSTKPSGRLFKNPKNGMKMKKHTPLELFGHS